MSPLLVLLLIIAGLWLALRTSAAFGDWCGRLVDKVVARRVAARVARLRAVRRAEGRALGGPADVTSRLYAGAVDLGGAILVGAVLAIVVGLSTTTTYSYDGTSSSSTGVD